MHIGGLVAIAIALFVVTSGGPAPNTATKVSALPALGGGSGEVEMVDVVGTPVSATVAHGAIPSPAAAQNLIADGAGSASGGGKGSATASKSAASDTGGGAKSAGKAEAKVEGGGAGVMPGVAPVAPVPDVNTTGSRPALSMDVAPF